eukprot:symbB.v1.2.026888.t1/scaffold2722.1/size72266/2
MHLLNDWNRVKMWMKQNGLAGQVPRSGGHMSEFLLTAVRKRPNVATATMPPPFADAPLAGRMPVKMKRRREKRRDLREFLS